MHIRFVCRAGCRRSIALKEYVSRADPGIITSSSPFDYDRHLRSLSKRGERLARMQDAYTSEVSRLREGGGHVHPRFGVLMLQDGIESVASHRSVRVNDRIDGVDLVLTVDYNIARVLRDRYPAKSVYPVMSFIGESGSLPDIKVYSLPFLSWQMREDRELLDSALGIAQKVVRVV